MKFREKAVQTFIHIPYLFVDKLHTVKMVQNLSDTFY